MTETLNDEVSVHHDLVKVPADEPTHRISLWGFTGLSLVCFWSSDGSQQFEQNQQNHKDRLNLRQMKLFWLMFLQTVRVCARSQQTVNMCSYRSSQQHHGNFFFFQRRVELSGQNQNTTLLSNFSSDTKSQLLLTRELHRQKLRRSSSPARVEFIGA